MASISYIGSSTNGVSSSSSSSSRSSSNKDAVPPTPSKVMFSPMLRETQTKGDDNGAQSLDECREMAEESGSHQEEEEMALNTQESEIITTNGNDENEEIEEEDDDVFNPYLFIAGLPHHSLVTIRDKCCLPALSNSITDNKTAPITLVLDLDETLVTLFPLITLSAKLSRLSPLPNQPYEHLTN